MKTDLIFNTHPVRVAGTPDAPLFAAADICAVLELSNPSKALDALDADEKGLCLMDTPGGRQQMLCVTESGLYHLIFKSRKETAKRFRRWVTEEVLPEIRRNGSYLHTSHADPFAKVLAELREETASAIDAYDEARHRLRMAAAKRDAVIGALKDAAPYNVSAQGLTLVAPRLTRPTSYPEFIALIQSRHDLTRFQAKHQIKQWLENGSLTRTSQNLLTYSAQ